MPSADLPHHGNERCMNCPFRGVWAGPAGTVAHDIEVRGVLIKTRQQCPSLRGDDAGMPITAGELPHGVPAVERHDCDELDLCPLQGRVLARSPFHGGLRFVVP